MGSISKRVLRSGDTRYDARERINSRVVTRTFRRYRDAQAWLTSVEADRLRGVAVDPRLARVTLREYANAWLKRRHDLGERTAELYTWVLTRKILPRLGDVQLGQITPSMVRAWHAEQRSRHPATAAKSYRLLSTIMNTAIADEVITRNPCQVKGAGSEQPAERPVLSVAEIAALVEAMPESLRLVVILAAWCQLRRAEIMGLRRRDVDPLHGTVTVRETRTRMMNRTMLTKEPKSQSSKRVVAVPSHVLPVVTSHLANYVDVDQTALLIPARTRELDEAWWKARVSIGRRELRLHDLRHTGLTLTAAAGATIAELMYRAGHTSPRAAILYQHATRDRDRVLADALAGLAQAAPVVPISGAGGDARTMTNESPSAR